jgi:hypothetical protein
MKSNIKLSRNLWIISGFCFLLAFILNLLRIGQPLLLLILDGLTCILCFVNAYMQHKQITKDNFK